MTEQTCQVTVNRGDGRWSVFQPCGRKVKADGLCGIHLAAKQRRAQKDAEWQEAWDHGNRLQKEAAQMSQALGVRVEAYYNTIRGEYDGRFVVDAVWLREQAKGGSR